MGKKATNGLLFLLVVLASVGLTVYVGQNAKGMMIYNFVFLGIMAILFLVGMFGGMFRVLNLVSALKDGRENLEIAFAKKGRAEKEKYRLLSGVFQHEFLDDKMEDFVAAVTNSEEGIVEVEEYLNEEELDLYVHKRLLEMVPDILTSLGILGTFIGLVWGLKDFSPNNYEAMTNSVASLVEGIKVAFLTSIYGISLSIVYSYGMRSSFSSLGERLQAFLNYFHISVLPTAESESRNQMISNAKEQNEKIEKMSEQIAKELARSFEKTTTPVFNRMSASLDRLTEAMEGSPESAVEEIVQKFLQEMNRTFRVQLSNFDSALEDVQKTQMNTSEYTASLYKNLSKELNDSYAKQERLMKDAVRDLVSSMDNYTRIANDTAGHNLEMQKQTQVNYEHVLSYMQQAERTSGEYWEACNQSMQKYVELAASSTEKVGNAGKVSAAVIRENRAILQTLDERIQKYAYQEQETARIMSEVSVLLSAMRAERSEDNTRWDNTLLNENRDYEKLQNAIKEQGERQEELLRELIESVRDLSKSSKKFRLFR